MCCPYVFTRGAREGQACGVKPRDGGTHCSKHRASASSTAKVASPTSSKPKTKVPAAPPTPKKPNKQTLIDLFNTLNKKWLDGEYTLLWDNARRRFGLCRPSKKEISLSLYMLDLNGAECLLDTVRHEIAHALDYKHDKGAGHGATWKKWAVKLGATPKACSKTSAADPKAKYILRDRITGEVFRSYYRKPNKIGDVPGLWIRGKKSTTINRLEIVTTGTPLKKKK